MHCSKHCVQDAVYFDSLFALPNNQLSNHVQGVLSNKLYYKTICCLVMCELAIFLQQCTHRFFLLLLFVFWVFLLISEAINLSQALKKVENFFQT